MPVPTVTEVIEHIAGDALEIELILTEGEGENETPIDLTIYSSFKSQWRVSPTSKKSVELTVDSSQAAEGKLYITKEGETTREWYGPGFIDIQAMPGPKTIVRIPNFKTVMDGTR